MTNRNVFRIFLVMTVIFTILIFCSIGKIANYFMNFYPPFSFFSLKAFFIGMMSTAVLMSLTTLTLLVIDLINQYRQSKMEKKLDID